MTARRVGTSALSVFAGVSLISAGVVSAFLAGTHPTEPVRTTAATTTCGQHPATAVTNSAAIKAANAQLQADSASAKLLNVAATASATSTPTSATSTPTSVPIDTASATSSSTPTSTGSASSTPTPTDPPSSTPSATPTSSPSTTPTPTPTASSPTVLLCVSVQAVTTSGVVPGGTASYAIWIWPAGGGATSIKVTASAKVAAAVTPRFSVCPTASGATCTVGTLPAGQADELLAKVTVPKTAKAGQHVTLTATAKGTGATSAKPASASVLIAAKAAAKPTATPAPSGSAGVGVPLPTGISPLTPVGVAASALLPTLPAATTDPGVLFPTVAPAASSSASTGTLPNARGVRVTDASDSLPLNTRLVGGQVLGLAVLAAALVIAIARLSLREPRTQQGKDDSAP